MKKIIFAVIAFLFALVGTNCLLAADSDFKNTLLKIEVSQTSDNSYDIGFYTQKIYNEPIKVVKKTDTSYYMLLPETSNGITSVPVVGAIKEVSVKSYPYAGQDLNNAYTKVMVYTTGPVNLTTSLRTLDASVSPRLNPTRLAKLDQVFERYSQRLAMNNVSSPLNEFKGATKIAVAKTSKEQPAKTAPVIQTPAKTNVQKNTQANTQAQNRQTTVKTTAQAAPKAQKTENTKIAQSSFNPSATKSLEDYQNKSIVNQTSSNKTTVKPSVSEKKTQSVQTTAQKAPVVSVTKQNNQSVKQTETKAPKTAEKVAAVTKKPVLENVPKKAPIAEVKKTVQTAQVKEQKSVKETDKKQTNPIEKIANATKKILPEKTQKVQTTTSVTKPVQTIQIEKKAPVSISEPIKAEKIAELKKVKEFESQLATTKPVDADFVDNSVKTPVQTETQSKKVEKEEDVNEVTAPVQKQSEENKNDVQNAENDINMLWLAGIFAGLLGIYAIVKIFSVNKKMHEAELYKVAKNSDIEVQRMRELIRNKGQKRKDTLVQEPHVTQDEEVFATDLDTAIDEVQDTQSEFNPLDAYTYENIEAEESQSEEIALSENSEEISIENAVPQAEIQAEAEPDEDNELIDELYTPIEADYSDNDSMAAYNEDENITNEYANSFEQVQEQNEDPNSATIVASSKLTETRGLYLAKFDGATSLVGYIQDEIYVLYNFGNMELQDTNIQSSLAQENDTDSLYIVKTGGKKLMVKSSPFDMSLEMVM